MLQRVGSFRMRETLNFSYQFRRSAPLLVANAVVNHFVEGFRLGGYRTNASMKGWDQRQFTKGKGQRATLVKSGKLRRDILKRKVTPEIIVVGTSQLTDSYASIHNEGGNIRITEKMRKFFWAMHYKSKGAEKEYWKSLALHRGNMITIPKREFIGDSTRLEVRLQGILENELKKIFK